MAEQKTTAPAKNAKQGVSPHDSSQMTQLEGIRQKVFMDRYSLKDANGKPLEFYPEQLWARVARGIAEVEPTPELQKEWEQRFYEALENFQFVPGGRILAGAGSGHQVTFYNCMPPDQEVLTADGYRPISDIRIGDMVVTHRNRLRPVLHKFERETEEPLYIIRPRKMGYDDLRLTGDHKVYVVRSEWVNKHKSRDGLRLQHEPDWIPAKDIKPGDYVAVGYNDEESSPDTIALHDYVSGYETQDGKLFKATTRGPDSNVALLEPETSIVVKHSFEYDDLKWMPIDEIAVEDYTGTVMDIEVEEDHSFISAGVVVSNCYVIPSPEDSRQGILDNLKLMTEIMARGGGVGINLSTLRPRGSYIKTVNGTASGPCSWAQLYSVATGDVIQQGGSRRGALMLMLDDTHPDIEEFITVKRTPGKIEHANLSVCVSDKFMQAVKDDTDWDLTWQGEVKKTIRARDLWDLICTSAWASAEPGVVFIDRYNKLSNTWYYEDIRCVNPCVTGDTLIYTDQGLIPARELAERGTPVTVATPDIAIRELTLAGHASEGNGLQTITQSSGSVSFHQASHVFPTGIKPVYRLQTVEGYTLRLTSDHRVLTTHGWKAASDLVAGDKIHALSGDSSDNLKQCLATFESLTPDGEEMVYDLSEPVAHQFVANGLVAHNCGEQGLPPFGVCNLGAINLSAFVVDGKMDYARLAEVSKVAMRFLDNVVDATEYFIEENRVAQLGTRRTGLGTMGLADALIKMEIPYGSEESVPVIERIYSAIRDAAYEMSADIALEKGAFSHFERDKYMRGEFIKRLPKAIQEKIRKQGIRNAVLLTQAPTGTTSLFAGVSSGIEPVYDFAMVRRDRTGEHILYHPLLQAWRDAHPNEPTPAYFVSSNDLTPEEHVRVQATIQRYTDSSISKTVNAPNNHTVEQVQTLYRLAYEMGCKGVTYYRDGSRDAVLTRVADEKKAGEQVAAPGATMETVASIQDGVKPRPPVVHGYTRQINAPEGKINITINSDEHGPLEVFVNVGKAGSDIAALAEALGRLISLNLRILSPLSQTDRAREIADQLRGIGGSRSVGFGMQQVRSLPDAVARALEMHFDEMKQHEAEAESTPAAKSEDHINGHSEQAASLLSMSHMSITGNLCPQCGCNTMVYEEGCKKCYNCGYSEC